MSATDELRAMLDKHGIEHLDHDKRGRTRTQWEASDGMRLFTYETTAKNPGKTTLLMIAWHPTPEQAIAATLGPGTCHIEVKDNLRESEGMGDVWYECDACHWQFDYYAAPPKVHINYCPNCGCKVVSE